MKPFPTANNINTTFMLEDLKQWKMFESLFIDLKTHASFLLDDLLSCEQQQLLTPWSEKHLYKGLVEIFPLFWQTQCTQKYPFSAPLTNDLLSQWIPSLCNAAFCIIHPGTQIIQHQGFSNQVIRLQLSLKAPASDCFLNFDSASYPLHSFELFLYDDMKQHCAYNNSNDKYYALFIDLVRPLSKITNFEARLS